MSTLNAMINALMREMKLRKGLLPGMRFQSVYFGGGTPSVLSIRQTEALLEAVFNTFSLTERPEITFEVNPGDLCSKEIKRLRALGVNRLSIGVQSFDDRVLQMLNRTHCASDSLRMVKEAQDAGFGNINADLIFGIPGQNTAEWLYSLHTAVDMQVQHLSCYCLSIEPKTALAHFIKKGKWREADENTVAEQFASTMETLENHHFHQYEISNYAKKGFESLHNSNYWKQQPYIGIGPSAHSYYGNIRSWNVSNNHHYMKRIRQGELPIAQERLGKDELYNEYVMTGLRTNRGCHRALIGRRFGSAYEQHFSLHLKNIPPEFFHEVSGHITLSRKGKFHADGIASMLFKTGD